MKRPTQIAIVIVVCILIVVPTFYYFVYLPTTVPKKVRLGVGADPSRGYWELLYAEHAGIYKEEGIEVAKDNDLVGFVETSSKTGENVEISFETIAKLMFEALKNKE